MTDKEKTTIFDAIAGISSMSNTEKIPSKAHGPVSHAAMPTGEIGSRIAAMLGRLGSRSQAASIGRVSKNQLGRWTKGENLRQFLSLASLATQSGVSLDWLAGLAKPDRGARVERRYRSVPVIGLARCGLKSWFEEDEMSVTAVAPGDMPGPGAFAVIAVGKSMVPEGILNGFLCFCSPVNAADPGDAVYIKKHDGHAAIKVFLGEHDGFYRFMGYLDPEGDQAQKSFTDEIKKDQVSFIAPVIYMKRKL